MKRPPDPLEGPPLQSPALPRGCRRIANMNLIQTLEREQMEAARGGRKLPAFRPGDTLKVNVKVVDVSYDEKTKQQKTRERLQAFEGVCIARSGSGLNESFTVRKISYGEGVERRFPVYSPNIDSIKLVRRGKVRRAKLYYLRDRRGKSARIAEKMETPAAKSAREAAKKEAKASAKSRKAALAGDSAPAAPKGGGG